MKNLFYKEIKLAFHPLIWVIILIFPFMMFIPSYPGSIHFIYIFVTYPILFLGANRGVQTNDIYFTCLLPIKKSDAIKARLLSVSFIHFVLIAVSLILLPLVLNVDTSFMEIMLEEGGEAIYTPGLPPSAMGAVIGFALIALSVLDLIFFPLFYRNGRTIVLGSILGSIVYMTVLLIPTILLPYIIPGFTEFFTENLLNQFIFVAIGLIFYAISRFITYKISANLFEKVDL